MDSLTEEVKVATLDIITTEVVTTTTPEVEVEVDKENSEDHIKDQETTKLSNANSLNKMETANLATNAHLLMVILTFNKIVKT